MSASGYKRTFRGLLANVRFTPKQLTKLLDSLLRLTAETPTFEVILVDNDVDGSAKSVADKARENGLPVTYIVEPKKKHFDRTQLRCSKNE